ncbi:MULTISPECIES: helix-turn-helix domain-containing protein [Reichenbachiella]|uniref:Transcriptional regulator, AraC family n=1 Tax=Reichenbachiella agariperforans TaxID=156994 RepID=A0A1M6RYZ3_REIAG|nr:MULTISPECIES: AraC family transcriptional regulator [Reichenbachiella]MBU2914966.1 AraC family transcriptional regulator [Reichenbachiella agariperforans]RJE70397.1 AraC family transcriptional regulator [Reichenbachiella sp. MSK19-1]SHK37673.1 transcriptional regulator, AraC family [Reichenbachiella agariperforans]
MEDYNKIIESLGVRFISAKNINILQPVTIENYYDVENVFIYVHKGEMSVGKDKEVVGESEILFVPGGKMVSLTYGSGQALSLSNDDFINNKEKFFQNNEKFSSLHEHDNVTMINFEAKVFDTVNFFASLDIPPFVIRNNNKLISLAKEIVREIYSDAPGKARIVKLETEYVVVELIRHILDQGLFVEQLATNSTYFKDPRLIDIFSYIKDHLNDDLSNKALANVANVSEDYVGQYFKMLTGINPQDYIEYQRMEMAVNMLRTTKKSIRDIGKEVGFKDTAYFCRRFKMMFGIPAGKMRRRESLMNV